MPKAIPVEQDPWWQESTLIPVFQGFEDWGREAATDVKNLLTGWI
jgi:membrane protein required for colicin V production